MDTQKPSVLCWQHAGIQEPNATIVGCMEEPSNNIILSIDLTFELLTSIEVMKNSYELSTKFF